MVIPLSWQSLAQRGACNLILTNERREFYWGSLGKMFSTNGKKRHPRGNDLSSLCDIVMSRSDPSLCSSQFTTRKGAKSTCWRAWIGETQRIVQGRNVQTWWELLWVYLNQTDDMCQGARTQILHSNNSGRKQGRDWIIGELRLFAVLRVNTPFQGCYFWHFKGVSI